MRLLIVQKLCDFLKTPKVWPFYSRGYHGIGNGTSDIEDAAPG